MHIGPTKSLACSFIVNTDITSGMLGCQHKKGTIYAEGVKEKLRQVDYAIKSHQITRGNPDF